MQQFIKAGQLPAWIIEMKHSKLMGFLTIIGLIMIFIPVNLAIIMFLYAIFRVSENRTLFEFSDFMYLPGVPGYLPITAGAVFIIGLSILTWVLYTRHRIKR